MSDVATACLELDSVRQAISAFCIACDADGVSFLLASMSLLFAFACLLAAFAYAGLLFWWFDTPLCPCFFVYI